MNSTHNPQDNPKDSCKRKREYSRKYRAMHPEKVRQSKRKYYERNRERCCERTRAWREANPDKNLALKATRRARKLAALDSTASQTAIAALHAEAKMAEAFMGQRFAVDHVVPLSRGGKHHEDNLRVLPARLNSVKHARLDSEITDAVFQAWLSPNPYFEEVTYQTFMGEQTLNRPDFPGDPIT